MTDIKSICKKMLDAPKYSDIYNEKECWETRHCAYDDSRCVFYLTIFERGNPDLCPTHQYVIITWYDCMGTIEFEAFDYDHGAIDVSDIESDLE